jgi:ERF superfamily
MKKLTEIQNELKVPKGNYNAFGKYKYRSAEDILEAVKPLLKKQECVLTLTDELVEVGSKIYLKAIALFSDGEKKIECFGFAETSEHKGMSSEQATGTASSYARKYALNGLFLIDETQADADHQNKGVGQKKIVLTEINPNFIKVKEALAKGTHTMEQVKAKYEISSEIERLLK